MMNSINFRIASIFGLCKKTSFPGTLASLASLLFSFLTYYFLGFSIYVIFLVIFLFLGFWSIKKAQEKIGKGDFQWIGIDEWVGMWIANLFLFEFDFSLIQVIVFSVIAFIIFRFIDILKFIPPLPSINKKEDQDTEAVMLDDIIGGVYTYFLMLLIFGVYNLNYLYASIIFLLPAMIANGIPPFLKVKFLSRPINEWLFGKNKTWRGFLGAILFGTLSYPFILGWQSVFSEQYNVWLILLVGFLLSFGAIGGDLIESFFKRRKHIKEGGSWLPWDQIDYILGALLLTYPLYQYSLKQIVFLVIVGGAISALAHRLGYSMKINNAKQ